MLSLECPPVSSCGGIMTLGSFEKYSNLHSLSNNFFTTKIGNYSINIFLLSAQ
jgi:hypothetical protein